MYAEDDLLPISALQHLLFCPRQCGLIHLEQAWSENQLTAEGRSMHERAHDAGIEVRSNVRVLRGVRVRSYTLGLIGQTDVIELHPAGAGDPPERQVQLPSIPGRWILYPVEYKRGKPKQNDCDRAQICAQAMCLEEMLQTNIRDGALFYGRPRRRQKVSFDADLRQQTRTAAEQLHKIIAAGVTPSAVFEKKCLACSLIEICMPKSATGNRSAKAYLRRQIAAALTDDFGAEGSDEES